MECRCVNTFGGTELEKPDIFLNTTEIPWYDNLLKNPEYYREAKGVTGVIEYMHPIMYMKGAAAIQGTSISRQYHMIHENVIKRLEQAVEAGGKIPIPVLDYAADMQEGRHRAVLAEKLGIDSIPVLIVRKW